MMNKFISLLLCFVLIIILISPAFGDGSNIVINDTKDFLDFAKKCKTDTWSHGKIVSLNSDIDFSGVDFISIPTFGGTFEGNSHTISGVKIETKGSYYGFFRYVQKNGTVKDLKVSGTLNLTGTADYVGGIVGENNGRIINCTFNGDISGEGYIGGICGNNKETGSLFRSVAYGDVCGKSFTGGICGQNYGKIDSCINNASVNTTTTDVDLSDKEISLDAITEKEDVTELLDTNTDTGGICGYNKGSLEMCTNYGSIGYKSVGYNTGGICGRTAGYINGCVNYGEINGRKDIGGIVGQTEPYVQLEYSEDLIERANDILSRIRSIINTGLYLDDQRLADGFDNINSSITDITDSMSGVYDNVSDYADSVKKSIDDLSDRLNNLFVNTEYAFDKMDTGMNKINDGMSDFEKSCDYLYDDLNTLKDDFDTVKDEIEKINNEDDDDISASKYLENSMEQFSKSMAQFEDGVSSLYRGTRKMQNSIDDLQKALESKKNIEKNFEETGNSLNEIIDGLQKAGNSISDIADLLDDLSKQGYYDNFNDDVVKNLKDLAKCYKDMAVAIKGIGDGIFTMADDFDIYAAESGFRLMSKGFANLSKATRELSKTADLLSEAIDNIELSSVDGTNAVSCMKDGLSDMKDGANNLSDSLSIINSSLNDFTNAGAFKSPDISDDMSDNVDNMKNAVKNMQNEFKNVNNILREKQQNLNSNLNSALTEFEHLSDLINDAYNDKIDTDKDDLYEDISDYDNDNDRRGKTEKCKNSGYVYGDVNVGGIVGSMAIEYDFDPEDDISSHGEKSVNFTYKTKCIVRYCVNENDITVKKNFCGGISGKMDLGSILYCENYGKASSTDGNYIGGICGKSDTVIRNCAVKCELSGNDYIGGIAGEAHRISNCNSLVNIPEHGEFFGAISGKANVEYLSRNKFVGDEIGGVDDINYTGVAESVQINEFVSFVKSNFDRDVVFTLKFIADGKLISTVNFKYKDKIDTSQIPNVPDKKGYYGKWSDYNFNEATYDADIIAEYSRNVDIVESEEVRSDGKAVVLLCGSFNDGTAVKAEQLKVDSEIIDGFKVTIKNCYTNEYTVRYLPSSENTDLYIDYGSGLEKLSDKSYGSYKEFKAKKPDFSIYEMKKDYSFFVIYLILALVLCIAAVIIIKKFKRKRKKTSEKRRG